MTNSPVFSPWYDPENVELLRKWWSEEGLSANKISDNFKERGVSITKNAVIGRAHRTRLQPPEGKKKVQSEAAKQRMAVANMKRAQQAVITKSPIIQYVMIKGRRYHPNHKALTMGKETEVSSQSILLKDSKEGQCKAIVGYRDGKASLAVYCGKDVVSTHRNGRVVETSWCADHFARYTMEAKR